MPTKCDDIIRMNIISGLYFVVWSRMYSATEQESRF